MTIEADLLELMPYNVSVQKWVSQDAYGAPTYATAVSRYQARVEKRVRMVRDSKGQERVSNVTVYLGGSFGITPQDRIVLPDGTSPPILSVESQSDQDGAYYEAVYT